MLRSPMIVMDVVGALEIVNEDSLVRSGSSVHTDDRVFWIRFLWSVVDL